MSKLPAIGIDLGTTQLCVSMFIKDKPEVILDRETNLSTTPSYVAYFDKSEESFVVGTIAKSYTRNIQNVIYDVKRLIGKEYNDPSVQSFLDKWSFKVDKNKDGKAVIVIERKNDNGEKKNEYLDPTYVHAHIISKIAEIAKTSLNLKHSDTLDAVITVPAYFTDAQRQATLDAAGIVNLNVLSLLNESTAAMIAYGFENIKKETTIMVFDLGGGTIDVSIASVINNQYKVLATCGDTSIGGRDFDERIREYVLNEIKKEKLNVDISKLTSDVKFRVKLLEKCENAKIILTAVSITQIRIDEPDLSLEIPLSRELFEDLIDDLIKKAMQCIDKAINYANLKENEIDQVIVVGGSSKIPAVKNTLQQRFKPETLRMNINADHTIAHGAAIYAAKLSANPNRTISEINLQDITAFSIGILNYDQEFEIIIPRGTIIPYETTSLRTNGGDCDRRTNMCVTVYEGESVKPVENLLLGTLFVSIPPCRKHTADLLLKIEINKHGILRVTLTDQDTNETKSITVENSKTRLSEEQYNEMKTLAVRQLEIYEWNKEFLKLKSEFRAYCSRIELKINYRNPNVQYSEDDLSKREKISKAIEHSLHWLRMHNDLEFHNQLEERFEKLKHLVRVNGY